MNQISVNVSNEITKSNNLESLNSLFTIAYNIDDQFVDSEKSYYLEHSFTDSVFDDLLTDSVQSNYRKYVDTLFAGYN